MLQPTNSALWCWPLAFHWLLSANESLHGIPLTTSSGSVLPICITLDYSPAFPFLASFSFKSYALATYEELLPLLLPPPSSWDPSSVSFHCDSDLCSWLLPLFLLSWNINSVVLGFLPWFKYPGFILNYLLHISTCGNVYAMTPRHLNGTHFPWSPFSFPSNPKCAPIPLPHLFPFSSVFPHILSSTKPCWLYMYLFPKLAPSFLFLLIIILVQVSIIPYLHSLQLLASKMLFPASIPFVRVFAQKSFFFFNKGFS